MNLIILKQLAILSAFAGIVLGLVTIIPYVSFISFMILLLFLSAFILVYLKQNDLIGIINIREGCIYGAVIGFVSFIAFSVVYTPVLLMLLMAGISALFNGFTGLVTAWVYELITGQKKENDQNNSIDFEIK